MISKRGGLSSPFHRPRQTTKMNKKNNSFSNPRTLRSMFSKFENNDRLGDLITDRTEVWYDAKHSPFSRPEIEFVNSIKVKCCPYCGSDRFRKIVDSERKNPLIGSSRKLGLILLVPLLLVLSAIPLSFLFVKYAVIDGDVSLKLNVFLFLPVVLVLMSVTYFFLYHSVMVSLNSAIKDYRVNHKRDAEVNDGLSSSERVKNVNLTRA